MRLFLSENGRVVTIVVIYAMEILGILIKILIDKILFSTQELDV